MGVFRCDLIFFCGGFFVTNPLGAQPARAANRVLTVANESGEPVYHVFASDRTKTSFGTNRLDDILPPNASRRLPLPEQSNECLYDLKAIYKSGVEVMARNIDLCTGGKWVLRSSEAIFVQDSAASRANVSDDTDEACPQSSQAASDWTRRWRELRRVKEDDDRLAAAARARLGMPPFKGFSGYIHFDASSQKVLGAVPVKANVWVAKDTIRSVEFVIPGLPISYRDRFKRAFPSGEFYDYSYGATKASWDKALEGALQRAKAYESVLDEGATTLICQFN